MKNVILEEVLTLAFDQLKTNKADLSGFDSGRMMAFYEILSVAKEQADLLGVTFDDHALNTMSPEKLLSSHKQVA